MKILNIWGEDLTMKQLLETARDLKEKATLIAPTDTLYALMCDAPSPNAKETHIPSHRN